VTNPRITALVIIDSEDAADAFDRAHAELNQSRVVLLDLSQTISQKDPRVPDTWKRLDLREVFDADKFRTDFLNFFERWPQSPSLNAKSFDQLFRRPGGYSVWWTSVGSERQHSGKFLTELKAIWIVDQAIEFVGPERVLSFTRNKFLSAAIEARCRNGSRPIKLLRTCSHLPSDPFAGRFRWVLSALRQVACIPLRATIRSLVARWCTAGQSNRTIERGPAVVFTSRNTDYVRLEGNEIHVWFWNGQYQALKSRLPALRQLFLLRRWGRLLGGRWVTQLYHTAWSRMTKLKDAAPISERYIALGPWLRAVSPQIRDIFRYARLENSAAFRESFVFAGADVACLFVPAIRKAVAASAQWAQTVGAVAESLRAVGNVQAVVVAEELYRAAMPDIAAARELGIPSIGVQHGTIMPAHLIYTPPRGHIDGAPIPDYLAVFSEFAKEVVSEIGSFPPDRVWITGAPRLDHLVNDPPDKLKARARLAIPAAKRVVLIPTQTFAWFARAVWAVLTILKHRDDCLVCIKTHPKTVAMSATAYKLMSQEIGADNVLYFADRFEDLLAACDVLISASSTTLLEALILARQAICVNFSDEPDWYPYVDEGGALGARTIDELRTALDLALAGDTGLNGDTARQQFLRRHAGPAAGGLGAKTFGDKLIGILSHAHSTGHARVETQSQVASPAVLAMS
jgi:hypothetical protein